MNSLFQSIQYSKCVYTNYINIFLTLFKTHDNKYYIEDLSNSELKPISVINNVD